jgi:uncharacterized protein
MKSLALALLRIYKRWISPAFPPSCRYVPTCSEYAMEAVERFGAVRGGVIAFSRLLRCHPFAHGGLDPLVKVAAEDPTAPKGASEFGRLTASLKRYPDTNQKPSFARLDGRVARPHTS